MMISNPRFSLPTRFEMGTSTSSNSMYVEPLALTPEFSILVHFTPGALSGMINADIPVRPGPPVRTAAVQKSANMALVIHFFAPLTMYTSPRRSAVVVIPATSEPAICELVPGYLDSRKGLYTIRLRHSKTKSRFSREHIWQESCLLLVCSEVYQRRCTNRVPTT